MKYIYPLLPALFPVVFAASIQRDISSEDKLRDHLAMFRQVFNGDGQLLSPPEPPPATELRDEHNPRAETLKKLLAEMNLSDQLPNETSRRVPAVKSSPYNTYMADQFGNENSDHETTPQGQFEILPFLPSDRTFPGSSVINKDHSSDANSAKDDLIKTTDDSFDSTVDTPDIPEDSRAVSDDTSDLAEDSSRIFDDSLNTSLDLLQGPENRHNNTTNTTFLIPHANLHKNNTATADNTKDITQPEELSENDEDFEDERIPSLLADGLRSLLGNQSDYSATFEIPDLESEPQPSKVIKTPNLPDGIDPKILHSTNTTISVPNYESPPVLEPIPENSTPSSETDSVPLLRGNPPEGKANMKVVLDMNRKFRRPSSESSKLKKGYRPNVYAEPNATTVIDSSGKTNLKNIMEQGKSGLKNGIKSSVPSQSRDETKTETKPKSNMTPNKQAISEIRKLYFQSLEKSSEEDLLEYFHRIYPELEHLVGKKSKDYNSSDPSSVSDRVQEVLWASEPKSQPQPQPQPYPQTTHREKDSPSLPDQEETIQDGNVDPETLENHSESDYFKQFDDVKPSDPSNTTDISPPEKKGFMDQITSLYESYKPANFFHNPFHHVMVSEAASSAEICPSIVGAVIFGLFLILL